MTDVRADALGGPPAALCAPGDGPAADDDEEEEDEPPAAAGAAAPAAGLGFLRFDPSLDSLGFLGAAAAAAGVPAAVAVGGLAAAAAGLAVEVVLVAAGGVCSSSSPKSHGSSAPAAWPAAPGSLSLSELSSLPMTARQRARRSISSVRMAVFLGAFRMKGCLRSSLAEGRCRTRAIVR